MRLQQLLQSSSQTTSPARAQPSQVPAQGAAPCGTGGKTASPSQHTLTGSSLPSRHSSPCAAVPDILQEWRQKYGRKQVAVDKQVVPSGAAVQVNASSDALAAWRQQFARAHSLLHQQQPGPDGGQQRSLSQTHVSPSDFRTRVAALMGPASPSAYQSMLQSAQDGRDWHVQHHDVMYRGLQEATAGSLLTQVECATELLFADSTSYDCRAAEAELLSPRAKCAADGSAIAEPAQAHATGELKAAEYALHDTDSVLMGSPERAAAAGAQHQGDVAAAATVQSASQHDSNPVASSDAAATKDAADTPLAELAACNAPKQSSECDVQLQAPVSVNGGSQESPACCSPAYSTDSPHCHSHRPTTFGAAAQDPTSTGNRSSVQTAQTASRAWTSTASSWQTNGSADVSAVLCGALTGFLASPSVHSSASASWVHSGALCNAEGQGSSADVGAGSQRTPSPAAMQPAESCSPPSLLRSAASQADQNLDVVLRNNAGAHAGGSDSGRNSSESGASKEPVPRTTGPRANAVSSEQAWSGTRCVQQDEHPPPQQQQGTAAPVAVSLAVDSALMPPCVRVQIEPSSIWCTAAPLDGPVAVSGRATPEPPGSPDAQNQTLARKSDNVHSGYAASSAERELAEQPQKSARHASSQLQAFSQASLRNEHATGMKTREAWAASARVNVAQHAAAPGHLWDTEFCDTERLQLRQVHGSPGWADASGDRAGTLDHSWLWALSYLHVILVCALMRCRH